MEAVKFCSFCGRLIKKTYHFCPWCGKKKEGHTRESFAGLLDESFKPLETKSRNETLARLNLLEDYISTLEEELNDFMEKKERVES